MRITPCLPWPVLALLPLACASSPTVKKKAREPSSPALATSKPPSTVKPVLAVFDVEATSIRLSPSVVDQLSEYLAVTLVESGVYLVVPRAEIKKRLTRQKIKSYKTCFEQRCQVEIGRELAAQKTLSTKIMRLGERCTVTAALYDLRTSIAEAGAHRSGPCKLSSLVELIIPLVAKLTGKEVDDFRPLAEAEAETTEDDEGDNRPKTITIDCPDCVVDFDAKTMRRIKRYINKPRTRRHYHRYYRRRHYYRRR